MIIVEGQVAEMMTHRIVEILAHVERRGADTVLSALVRLVSATSPTNLQWQQFSELSLAGEQFSSCFQSSGSRYAINLFTGVVLTDGNAPGGLPVEIREHERFQDLFGGCNFEVLSTNGVFQAKETYCDRLYEFAIQAADEELVVQELTVDASRGISSTLQVCSLHWIKSFGELFPARLRDLYSHWYWVERDCVLFRPKSATSRRVFFVATLDNGALQCYQVPCCDWNRPYDEILDRLDEYDMFVRKEGVLIEVLSVLSKFEDEEFLHPLKTSDNILKIELPRFKLTFLLNDNMLESAQHKGFVLATQQQLDGFLPRFRRYLLLELRNRSDTSRPELRMLLPVGRVVENVAGRVDVDIPSCADSMVAVACYDLHRRLQTFETETIAARLQLAAVYVRAGTNVPSKRLQMTGAEAALQLLRACRSSSPFSLSEREALQTICDLSFRVPAVAVALLTKANQFGFLSGDDTADSWAMESADEKTEYGDMCSGLRHTVRTKLRDDEERLIFGQRKSLPLSRPTRELLALAPIPVAANCVKTFEAKLRALVSYTSASAQVPPLPLQSRPTDAMGKGMLRELQDSWDCHHAQPRAQLKDSSDALLTSFRTCLGEVSGCRREMEKYLNDAVAKWTRDPRDHLLSHVNAVPTLTVRDLVTCSFDDEILYAWTPHLTVQARDRFKTAVLQYMELCVLEDKVERLVSKLKHCDELSDSQVIDELETTRQWEAADYPYWLAFEVEGRLQIRHEQYVVAKHLIDAPGTVCQLNMGRGKTRVILPMLFLHFTRSRCPKVVRAHFLGSLLSEAGHVMHRFLSASSAQLHIFEQPFDRKIDLDARKLELLRDTLHEMKLFGGIQIVSPAHRMSLELKRLELRDDESLTGTLDEILENDQFVDVLDECDALLHHKYHLVYAVGTPRPLQSGIERWEVAEALLRVVAGNSSRAANLLRQLSCSCPDYAGRRGAFQGTRLQAAVESTEHLQAELKTALVLDLVENPPLELLWLQTLGRGEARDLLVEAITNPSTSLKEALGGHRQKFEHYVSQLLVLRGLVAFGVLEHCMEKRYRVDFGLPLAGPGKKKTAIPFRAADVPAERSEFSHPDVCIVLTLLGYYHGGLTEEEVRTAFENLLHLDVSEQRERYEQWYASVKPGLSDEEDRALCDVRQLSLSDERQFETLSRVYQFCMETINFYLNTCVFPKDTQQFPQRLSRTAWNLAKGDNNIGFSGTNDHHRLLPLSVTQREPDEPSLFGTNGKMIATILQVTQSYEVVRPGGTSIPWQGVLRFAVDKGAQALIDTGALLAGVSNHDAAEFLLGHAGFRFAGVTYYDSRKEHNCWMVMEKAHRMKMPLKEASMLERETLVIFDEARSRGSDMKLLPDAAAVLTLGPKLTKDKLMQGAGRMRQLGCNQTLWIASFDEVAQSILQASGKKSDASSLTTIDVLNWVMDNTKAESVRGLLEWASSGIHFRKTQLDRGKELVDEDWSLQTLYEEKITADKTARIVEAKAARDFGSLDDTVIADICGRSTRFGLDNEVCYTAHTDECERELHVEEEQEQEMEVEVAEHEPMKEKAWNYAHILGVQSIERLSCVVNVVSMASHIRQWVSPKTLESLAWSPARVFGTENFFGTIVARRNKDRMNEFLRVVDATLVFDNGQVLLLSECEADHILELLWSAQGRTACSFRFVNLAFARESIDHVGGGSTFGDVRLALGPGMEQEVPLLSVAACQLYNGETMLAKHQQSIVEPVFRDLLSPLAQREATLSNFVKSRGNGRKWTRSFLHKLCRRMDLETASAEVS